MSDAGLRRAFQALAAEDAAATPALSATRIDAARLLSRRRSRFRYTAALISLAAAAVAFVLVQRNADTAPLELPPTHWTAATDFLLNTPGRSLLRSVPSIQISTTRDSSRRNQ